MSIETAFNSPKNPIIKGVKIDAGGYLWEMPALNLRQLREYQNELKEADITDELSIFEVSVKAIQAALSRNYPALTLDDCLEIIDAGNFQSVMAALRGASGLVSSGEAAARQILTV